MRTRHRARWSARIIVIALSLAVAPRYAVSQRPGQAQPSRRQPEARADFIDSRAEAAHIGVGLTVPVSLYVRLGLVGAVGQAWSDGEGSTAGRVDGLVRFVVDPLREFRWAPYAAGGLSAIYDGSEKWRGVLVGLLGVEGPAMGRVVPAIEAGFGGGARVGVALRRALRNRR